MTYWLVVSTRKNTVYESVDLPHLKQLNTQLSLYHNATPSSVGVGPLIGFNKAMCFRWMLSCGITAVLPQVS